MWQWGIIFQTSKDMRQVRDRLAACRMIPDGETISDLPGGQWNVSLTRHVSVCVPGLFLFSATVLPILDVLLQSQALIKEFSSALRLKMKRRNREMIVLPVNMIVPSFSRILMSTPGSGVPIGLVPWCVCHVDGLMFHSNHLWMICQLHHETLYLPCHCLQNTHTFRSAVLCKAVQPTFTTQNESVGSNKKHTDDVDAVRALPLIYTWQ